MFPNINSGKNKKKETSDKIVQNDAKFQNENNESLLSAGNEFMDNIINNNVIFNESIIEDINEYELPKNDENISNEDELKLALDVFNETKPNESEEGKVKYNDILNKEFGQKKADTLKYQLAEKNLHEIEPNEDKFDAVFGKEMIDEIADDFENFDLENSEIGNKDGGVIPNIIKNADTAIKNVKVRKKINNKKADIRDEYDEFDYSIDHADIENDYDVYNLIKNMKNKKTIKNDENKNNINNIDNDNNDIFNIDNDLNISNIREDDDLINFNKNSILDKSGELIIDTRSPETKERDRKKKLAEKEAAQKKNLINNVIEPPKQEAGKAPKKKNESKFENEGRINGLPFFGEEYHTKPRDPEERDEDDIAVRLSKRKTSDNDLKNADRDMIKVGGKTSHPPNFPKEKQPVGSAEC